MFAYPRYLVEVNAIADQKIYSYDITGMQIKLIFMNSQNK